MRDWNTQHQLIEMKISPNITADDNDDFISTSPSQSGHSFASSSAPVDSSNCNRVDPNGSTGSHNFCVVCRILEPTPPPVIPRERPNPDQLLPSDVVIIIPPLCGYCETHDLFYCSVSCLLTEHNHDRVKCFQCRYGHMDAADNDSGGNSGTELHRIGKLQVNQPTCSCNWLQRRMSSAQQQWKCEVCQQLK